MPLGCSRFSHCALLLLPLTTLKGGTSKPDDAVSDASATNGGLIAGVSLGVVAAILLTILLTVLYYKRCVQSNEMPHAVASRMVTNPAHSLGGVSKSGTAGSAGSAASVAGAGAGAGDVRSMGDMVVPAFHNNTEAAPAPPTRARNLDQQQGAGHGASGKAPRPSLVGASGDTYEYGAPGGGGGAAAAPAGVYGHSGPEEAYGDLGVFGQDVLVADVCSLAYACYWLEVNMHGIQWRTSWVFILLSLAHCMLPQHEGTTLLLVRNRRVLALVLVVTSTTSSLVWVLLLAVLVLAISTTSSLLWVCKMKEVGWMTMDTSCQRLRLPALPYVARTKGQNGLLEVCASPMHACCDPAPNLCGRPPAYRCLLLIPPQH
jgi:hypothetical protein